MNKRDEKKRFKKQIDGLITEYNTTMEDDNASAMDVKEVMMNKPMIHILIEMYEIEFNSPFIIEDQ